MQQNKYVSGWKRPRGSMVEAGYAPQRSAPPRLSRRALLFICVCAAVAALPPPATAANSSHMTITVDPQAATYTTQPDQIYVLRLEDDCFYVGLTNDPERRFTQHKEGKGSAWTRLHHPIELMSATPRLNAFHEDQVTQELMLKHGIHKVRGGVHSMLEFSPEKLQALKRTLWHAANACIRCGRPGHFIKSCHETHDVDGERIRDEVDSDSEDDEEMPCSRCGRRGHMVSNCYAGTHVDGSRLSAAGSSPAHTPAPARADHCTRCGRESHTARDCYAKFHADGRPLNRRGSHG
jgi:predicted GIY-YIG superfamily endonuclease